MRKKIIFLLGALCSTSPVAFASSQSTSSPLFDTSISQENSYPNLAASFPEKFSNIDFALLQNIKEMYKDLSPEQAAAQDLVHNPLLEPTVRAWQDLFALTGGDRTAFLDADITERLENCTLTLEWVSLLPMRFAAAISGTPTQEEINIYNWGFYEPNTQHESFFDPTIYTSHEAFKELFLKENLPSLICFRPRGKSASVVYPFIGAAQLKLHEMVLMNLDHIFPIGVPTTPQTSEVHGIQKPTAFGFAVHDDLHTKDAHNKFIQALDNTPDFTTQENAAHILRQKHDLITDVLKFVFYKTLKNADMDLSNLTVRRMVLALFLGVHENGTWPNALYRAETPEDIIDAFVTFVLKAREGLSPTAIREDEKDADHDAYHTSPIDGSTTLSDTDLDAIFVRKSLERVYKRQEEIESALKILELKQKQQSILRDHNIIKFDTKITSDDNNMIFSSKDRHFTLNYRLNDAKGMRSLLSYASIKVPALTVESLAGLDSATASRQALTYLNSVASVARELVTDFGHQAKALLQTPEMDNLRMLSRKITWQDADENKIPLIQPFLIQDMDPLAAITVLLTVKDFSLERLQTLAQTLQENYETFFSQSTDSDSQMPIFNALISLESDQIFTLGKHVNIFFQKGMHDIEKEALIRIYGNLSNEQVEAIVKNADFYLPQNKNSSLKITRLEHMSHLSPVQIERLAARRNVFDNVEDDLILKTIKGFQGMSADQIDMITTHLPTFLETAKKQYNGVGFLKDLSPSQIEAIAMNPHVFMNQALDPYATASAIAQTKDLTPEGIHNVAKLIEEKVINQNKNLTHTLSYTAITNPDLMDYFLNESSNEQI